MPNIPKPYKKGNYWVTSAGGEQHQKLCPLSDGFDRAQELLQAFLVKDQGWTVCVAVEKFLAYKAAEKSAGTASWYTDRLQPFLERFRNDLLANISLEMGVAFKEWLLQDKEWVRGKKQMKGVSRNTCNGYMRAAKTLFNWCCKSQQRASGLTANPWHEMDSAVSTDGRERLITDAELQILLDNCKAARPGGLLDREDDFREQLLLLRQTTLRPGELRQLRWEYINWDQHQIIFPAEVIKTKKRREVTLLDSSEDLLRCRQARLLERGATCQGTDFVFAKPGRDKDGRMVAGLGNAPIKNQSLSQKFRRLFLKCVRLGLLVKEKVGERLVPYSARHSRISELVREGHQPSIIMREAGHTNPATTERYIHLAGSDVAEQIRKGRRA